MTDKIPPPPRLSEIVYSTQFNKHTKNIVGLSTDSGFKSINEVVDAMGLTQLISRTQRLVIYGNFNDVNHVGFSTFPFYLGDIKC